jgi:hypothetical protein
MQQKQQQASEKTEGQVEEASPELGEGAEVPQPEGVSGVNISSIADDLSTEQIIELLQNAQDSQNASEGQEQVDDEGNPIQVLPQEVQLQL